MLTPPPAQGSRSPFEKMMLLALFRSEIQRGDGGESSSSPTHPPVSGYCSKRGRGRSHRRANPTLALFRFFHFSQRSVWLEPAQGCDSAGTAGAPCPSPRGLAGQGGDRQTMTG